MRLKVMTYKRWKRAGSVRYLAAFNHYQNARRQSYTTWCRRNAIESERERRLGIRGRWVTIQA